MKYELKTHNTIAYNCHYHVVFCPKYRRKVLVNGVDERVKTILIETIEMDELVFRSDSWRRDPGNAETLR